MTSATFESWGRFPRASHRRVLPARWRDAPLPLPDPADGPVLPFGNGRSYGDVCLNNGGALISTHGLDRFIAFDADSGVLTCEAGVLLAEVLAFAVPRGWFLPVTPGTRYVTLAGAIANDVHGKNHHRAGTFGGHVLAFELLRSDGSRRLYTAEQDAALFRATIGGLGLTGLITWATIRLRPIDHPYIAAETIRYDDLGEFFTLSAESDAAFEYTVAWVDCLAQGARAGRGVFFRGNHAPAPPAQPRPAARRTLTVPLTPPVPLINHLTLAAFNAVYHGARRPGVQTALSHYEPFFYPLDSIARWNRIYGPRGFLQYQFVVPHAGGEAALREVLARIARVGEGSFLAVLKVFGTPSSPGLLSFPRPGITLALDFPNRGRRTLALLDALDQVVYAAGGRLYPAKDARMHGADFRRTYPDWAALEALRDPRFDSSFWRRVREGD